MTQKMRNFFLLLFILIIQVRTSFCMVGINLFRAYDINLLPHHWPCERVQAVDWAEFAYRVHGFNHDGAHVPVTQIWSDRQNALAMLRGFPASSPITQFLQNVLGDPADDGTRGMISVNGHLKAQAYGMFVRGFLPHNMVLGVYVPFYHMSLKGVSFTDVTNGNTATDELVRQQLTSNVVNVIHQFDPSLHLGPWSRTGFGDTIVMAEWCRDFKQNKPILKNVFLTARLGLNIPTGVKRNEDDFFSVPFGLDGSAALIFGAGLTLNWYDRIRWGLDFQFMYAFGNTRDRRIKTHEDQTDLFLLAKVKTHKDFGFFQRYNLFLGVDPIFKGFSAKAIYQFFKHTDDTLSLCSNTFSDTIANTANSLQEWTMHHIILMLTYNFQTHVCPEYWLKPELSFFAKWPINGERAIMCHTLGFIAALHF